MDVCGGRYKRHSGDLKDEVRMNVSNVLMMIFAAFVAVLILGSAIVASLAVLIFSRAIFGDKLGPKEDK